MKKSLIVAIAVLLPVMASASQITPGYGSNLNCIPWNPSMVGQTGNDWSPSQGSSSYHHNPDPRGGWITPTYQGQTVCPGGDEEPQTNMRLYNLEVAVQALQSQNAALQSQVNLMQAQGGTQVVTTGNTSSLEARVSALESVTKSIQQSLVYVVQLLTDTLNKVSGR